MQELGIPDDVDGDLIEDWWEREHFGSTAALPDADADNDGHGNLDEFRAGTDPTNASSVLIFTETLHPPDGSGVMVLRWNSVTNRAYNLLHSPALTQGDDWATVDGWSNMPGNGSTLSYTGQVVSPRQFYRVSTEP